GPALGAAAGILFAMLYGVVLWNMGFLAGMKAFTAAVLGGIGNIPGAMLGGLLLGLVETFGAGYLPFITAVVIGPEYKAIYAIGAYSYALLASPYLGLHVPFWLVLPIAPLIAAAFGVLLGAPTLRLRGDYLAIVTLGFGEVIRILLNNLDVLTNGPRGVINI